MISIQPDKLGHFFWSSVLLIILVPFLGICHGSIALIIIAVLKEVVYDWLLGKGKFEVLDIVYGSAPVLIYWILFNSKDLYLLNTLINIL